MTTPSALAPHDPYLDLPLEGVQLIEASAGTGKTFTLATLVTRLVVERGLRIGQVLAVTFTEAATQELRKRIRERLLLALALLDTPVQEGESAAATLTRQLLQAHLASSNESNDALRRRLRQATLEIDLAAIFTIHGFCARALREHALESGQGFDPPELLTNDSALREALAADLWRSHASGDDGVDDLLALWPGGHAALASDLPALLREPVLLPPMPGDDDIANAQTQMLRAEAGLQQAWHAHGEAFLDDVADAIDADILNRGSYKPEWLADLRRWLQTFATDPRQAGEPHPKLEKLSAEHCLKGTKKAHVGKTPESPHFESALGLYLEARQLLATALGRRRVTRLHRIRDDARARLALLKQQARVQTYDDLIEGVAGALEGANADALVRRLREQYRVALVDEFQDTDARQWKIFDRVFGSGIDNDAGESPALFLIGDPKQAIYSFRGGDVHAYLEACKVATPAPPLVHNFRSRPVLLKAIAALYGSADNAFVTPGIQFQAIEPGGNRDDGDFIRDSTPAPALTIWRAPDPEPDDNGKLKPHSAPQSRELATQACVAAIHGVLSDARANKALLKNGDAMRPVQPGDIAVLVRTHYQATMIQQALALVGIPAVAAGKQSLFATPEARELHALLLALLNSGDDGRLRTALSTVLVGVDAASIDASDGNASQAWQHDALAWRERLLRGGPLALVGDLCATHAPRLLGLLDGERRVSNYLQLAELLQEAQDRALGLHGLVDWLGQQIASADANDETQLLRLESDARRVQIVTLHKSKGLEYPLVFLPFIGVGSKEPSPGSHCIAWDDAQGRRLHWKFDLPEAEWESAKDEWKQEQRAEDARLLYVGLTRAEHALWIASGDFYRHDKTPLASMLRDPSAFSEAGSILFDDGTPPASLQRLPPESNDAIPPARKAERKLSADWWVYSFSQLARADAGDQSTRSTEPLAGGNDEPDAVEDAPVDASFDPRFAGKRYGVALHAALEHADFGAWRGWLPGDEAPADESNVIATALAAEGYGKDEVDEGTPLTAQLIGQTLTVALPEGTRLCDLPADQRRAEIDFQFSLQPVQVDALLRLLHAHGIVRERHGFGLRHRLEGLMTGLIDLTYRHDGRWYVLDYKSNRLPRYDAAALQDAMAHSEYDLQALIYTLALHRWLRFRLGDAYDYARDFGGIRYLFCRGLDATQLAADGSHAPGIHAQRFEPELIDELDALFAGGVA